MAKGSRRKQESGSTINLAKKSTGERARRVTGTALVSLGGVALAVNAAREAVLMAAQLQAHHVELAHHSGSVANLALGAVALGTFAWGRRRLNADPVREEQEVKRQQWYTNVATFSNFAAAVCMGAEAGYDLPNTSPVPSLPHWAQLAYSPVEGAGAVGLAMTAVQLYRKGNAQEH